MTGQRLYRTTEAIPRHAWKFESPLASRPIKISATSINKVKVSQAGARGAREVRCGSSSVVCSIAPPVPCHIGPKTSPEIPLDDGCPWMGVCTEMLVSPRFRGPDRSFWPWTSAGLILGCLQAFRGLLSAPNYKSQIASDLKSRSPNRKNFPQSGVAPANQTKERSVHELFAGAFRNKSSMHKNSEIHELFVLALSLVWFAGGTPDPNRSLGRLKSHFQIARFVIWASVQIAVRIAMPFPAQVVRTMSSSEKVHSVSNR